MSSRAKPMAASRKKMEERVFASSALSSLLPIELRLETQRGEDAVPRAFRSGSVDIEKRREKEREKRERKARCSQRGECALLADFSLRLDHSMNFAPLLSSSSSFLPSTPLYPPSRRHKQHHQPRKMASVTAYIEEKDLAAKVRIVKERAKEGESRQ